MYAHYYRCISSSSASAAARRLCESSATITAAAPLSVACAGSSSSSSSSASLSSFWLLCGLSVSVAALLQAEAPRKHAKNFWKSTPSPTAAVDLPPPPVATNLDTQQISIGTPSHITAQTSNARPAVASLDGNASAPSGTVSTKQALTPFLISPGSSSSSSSFFASLTSNPLFSAGAGIAGLGVGAALLRRAGLDALRLFERYCTVSLEITSKDKSYFWLLNWFTRNAKSSQHLSVETSYSQSSSGDVSARFSLVPSPGVHWLWYHGRLLRITREREKSVIDFQTGSPWESVKLFTFGSDRKVFYQILNESRDMHVKAQEGKTIIYTPFGTEWQPFGDARKRRPLSTVILAEGMAEMLMSDIREFTKSQQWYMDRGVPYRRGYLLYGPPGCGKSSFIQGVAAELAYSICILHLSERGLTDDRLIHLLAKLPPRAILLLEDIDAALKGHRQQAHYQIEAEKAAVAAAAALQNGDHVKHSQLTALHSQFIQNSRDITAMGVTFSGLLNALDGVASTEERIVFMTTNHLQLLDGALIRPGRIDVKVEIGLADSYQMKKMFNKFYPQASEILADNFVTQLESLNAKLSIAELQAHFLLHKDDAKAAVDQVRILVESSAEFARRRRMGALTPANDQDQQQLQQQKAAGR